MSEYNSRGILCLTIKEYAHLHCRVPSQISNLMRQGRIEWEFIGRKKHIPATFSYPERKAKGRKPNPVRVTHCRRRMQPGWRFCPRCGERIDDA